MGVTVYTADDFSAALDDWADANIEPSIVEAQKEVVAATFNALTGTAPRWSGRYVGSINVQPGEPDPSFLPPHPATIWGHGHKGQKKGVHRAVYWPDPVPDPYQEQDIGEIMQSLNGIEPYSVVYLSESVPYAGKIEDGGSRQAPAGVFHLSAALVTAEMGRGYSWQFLSAAASLS